MVKRFDPKMVDSILQPEDADTCVKFVCFCLCFFMTYFKSGEGTGILRICQKEGPPAKLFLCNSHTERDSAVFFGGDRGRIFNTE